MDIDGPQARHAEDLRAGICPEGCDDDEVRRQRPDAGEKLLRPHPLGLQDRQDPGDGESVLRRGGVSPFPVPGVGPAG